MAQTIKHIRSAVAGKVPTTAELDLGVLAINTHDGKAFLKKDDGTESIVEVTTPAASTSTAGKVQLEDSTSSTSTTTAATPNSVKSAYDLANAALPKAGGTITGNLEIGASGSLTFEGSTANDFETTLAVTDPTADRTITLPNVSGTLITTGDSGTVTSAMLANGTIVNEDVNASAAIAGTKISPDFGAQNVTTTGTSTAASFIPTSSTVPTNGVYLPAANSVAISTNSVQRVAVDANGNVAFDTNTLYVDAVNNRVAIGTSDTSLGNLQLSGANGVTLAVKNTTGTLTGTEFCQITLNNTNNSSGNFESAKIKAISTNGGANLAHLTFENSGTERARIDSSGRLLVGTSTARAASGVTSAFQVEGSGSYDKYCVNLIGNSNVGAPESPFLIFGRSRGTSNGSFTVVQNGDRLGGLTWTGANGSNLSNIGASIECYVDGAVTGGGANDMPGRLVFSTTADGASSPTERMRIDSEGNIRFGNVGYFREVQGSPYVIEFGSFPGTTYSVERQIQFYTNFNVGSSAERMRISGTGAIFFPSVGTTASAANAFLNSGSSPTNQLLRSTSSLRYKTNIEDLEEERSNLILNFRPVWYRSTADADRKDWSWYGLIAEEVAEIEPRLVHWTYLDDAYEEVDGEKQLKPNAEMVPDGVQYDRLTVLLLDVVKRQQQSIETLEAKVAALETP